MNQAAAARERLFGLYSEQLGRGGVTPTGIFICPLCGEGYTREALEGTTPSVSLAHIVPEALGGRVCTLTCTPCNNGNGNRIEAALAEHLRYDDWTKGVGSRQARMTGVFGDIGVDVELRGGAPNLSIYFARRRSNPAHLTNLTGWLAANAGRPDAELTWNLRWTAPDRPHQVNAAIYQSAYLLLFSYFGYGFAFRPEYIRLREQVLKPDESVWPGHINVLAPEPVLGLLGKREVGVMFGTRPFPCVVVFLRFRPPGGCERVLGVLLPPPGTEEVPTVECSAVSGDVVPYRPDLLVVPSHMRRMWNTVQSRASRS